MAHRRIGQEALFPREPRRPSLDEIADLIDWSPIEARLSAVYAAPRGEASWPPLALFRALLLAVWHDLSDVRLAEALEDRGSCRRFCGFARTEATPERTAFVRFRRELLRHGLDQTLVDLITAQLRRRAAQVTTDTLVDASVVDAARRDDAEAGGAGHSRRKAVHGYKVHVGADAETALAERLAVTPGNVHDGNHGESALPTDPGEVYADRAYRGRRFAAAVQARGGTPRTAAVGVWAQPDPSGAARGRALARRTYIATSPTRYGSATCTAPPSPGRRRSGDRTGGDRKRRGFEAPDPRFHRPRSRQRTCPSQGHRR